MKIPESRRLLWIAGALLILICGVAYYFFMPVAEVAVVRRGTAISAVYGTVRIEPAFVVHVRAQNSGFIQLAEEFSAGRGAIGKSVTKGQVLATIADEKSEVNRLRGARDNERIESDRNLQALGEAYKKLEAQMRNSEIRAPMDGLLSAVLTIDSELVNEGNQLFTISSRKTFVRGEVNEEDVGEVKPGMKAKVQLYAYRNNVFPAKVASVQPAADPDTQRYTVILEMEKAPDNLMAGMTGEMNIITGMHENALLLPTRALIVDQAWLVKRGIVRKKTIKVGFRTLDFSEALSGISAGDRVVVSDQDRLRTGEPVRQRRVDFSPKP